MIIHQILTPPLDNFTYILGCEKTRNALVIDPTSETDRIVEIAEDDDLRIKMIVNTHGHGDHTIGNGPLRARTGAPVMIHPDDADRYPAEANLLRDPVIQLGELAIEIIHTPGHTPGGICLHGEGNLFTGDTLFVGDSGRTDLAGGNRPTLGASICRLMQLPDKTVVWPGHNYGPTPTSTIGWERRHNVNAREYGFYR